ncbi:MAG: thioesterase family protein [Nocardioides sp.]|nr:thioesterase family protein [Nocardioides sp.]
MTSSPEVNPLAFFRATETGFEPEDLARSLWSHDQMHGVAASGLIARTMEREIDSLGRSELVPSRYHVDLFRPPKMVETYARATVVRNGPRIVLIDVDMVQGETVVARASGTYLQPSANPTGKTWSPSERPTPPPLEIAPVTGDVRLPLFASEAPWSTDFADHQNAGRHQSWQVAVPTVVGEPMTTFQAVASMADSTSMITNWSDHGIEWINTDISLALTRRPVSLEVGLSTVDHVEHEGVAVGTAEVFDRAGTLGTANVTAIANTRRTVDLSANPEHTAAVNV